MTSFFALLVATAAAAQPYPAPSVRVGDPALLFSLPALNEDAAMRAVARPHVALSDFTGVLPGFPARVVVVHFLRMEGGEAQLAALNRLHRRYANRGARFVAVLVDDTDLASASDWVEGQKLDFPVLRDNHRIVVDRYGVLAFPMTFVIDGDGAIDAIGVPGAEIETSLDTLVTPFLKD